MNKKKFILPVSIICPTYNSSNFIFQNIKSIINQIYLPAEIIFVDDHSNDRTIYLLKNIKNLFDKKISVKILSNKKNMGPGYSRNLGIKHATQSWIGFLDSDDCWNVLKLYKLFKKKKIQIKHNLILNWEKEIDTNHNIKKLKYGENYYDVKKNLTKLLYKKNFFSTSAIICKKNLLFKSGLFDETMRNAQDYDLWIRISKFTNLVIIKDFLGIYKLRKNNISSKYYLFKVYNLFKIAFKYRSQVGLFIFLFRIFRICLSRQWLK